MPEPGQDWPRSLSFDDPKSEMTLCKGCGKPIVWGIDSETSKKIPLDPRPPIYAISSSETVDGCVPVIRLKKDEAAVSHFATCPKANQF